MLIGHTLNAVAGLKPDFFAVTFVGADAHTVHRNIEEFYGGRLELYPVELDSADRFVKTVEVARGIWAQLPIDHFLLANLQFVTEAAQKIIPAFKSFEKKVKSSKPSPDGEGSALQ